ncbi:MAG: C40 family peptidase [Actinobacteria bacterium]|nr:C40 family peptidase [Actinomycetota bacterium]
MGAFSAGCRRVALTVSGAVSVVAAVPIGPVAMFASGGLLAVAGASCTVDGGTAQPVASESARTSIPADYLTLFRSIGARYSVPWVVLAGIGKVESDDGRSALAGVHSGSNAFGAAGPMQIGIGGAAGNEWGGAPAHPASERVSGVATDANGDGVASVYEPADAIAGAAKYLLAHGVADNVVQAVFAYNHLESYVQQVLHWAGLYASGDYALGQTTFAHCLIAASEAGHTVSGSVQTAIAYAEQQLGKPYEWGGTGPDAFDCSGLVLMAYRTAGITIPRTSQEQWAFGPQISASAVQPGDLVFFAGADGTPSAPGHVGLVIGNGLMIEAYATGYPVRIAPYGNREPVGFTRPWAQQSNPAAAAAAGSH